MYPKESSEEGGPVPGAQDPAGLSTEPGPGVRGRLFPPNMEGGPTTSSTELPSNNVNITVAPFTGGPFEVRVSKLDSVDELKKVIARRLKVSKERIYLLYRER